MRLLCAFVLAGCLSAQIVLITKKKAGGSITFVGSACNGLSSSSTSYTITYSPTSGNKVIVLSYTDYAGSPTSVSVADSGSNALTNNDNFQPAVCSSFACLQLFSYTAGSGITSYTVTFGSSLKGAGCVLEYTNTGAYDAGVEAGFDCGYRNSDCGGSGTTPWTVTSGTLGNANDLLVCWVVDARKATQTFTQSGGFTMRVDEFQQSAVGTLHVADWISPGSTDGKTCNGDIGVTTGDYETVGVIWGYNPS